MQRNGGSLREAQPLARGGVAERLRGRTNRPAQLHDPEVSRQAVDRWLQRRAVLALGVYGGVHSGARVDHQHVPGFEEVPEIPEPGVNHAVVVPV